MERILIVDDNADLCFNLSNILKDEGYKPIAVGDGRKALKAVKNNSPDLVILDIRLPGMDGMKVLEEMRRIDKNMIIIMLTACSDIKDAVKAMKLGAFDYITKPFNNEELNLIIKRALQTRYLSREVESLRKKLGEQSTIEEVMGESPKIKQVLKQLEIITPTNMTVILQGESGTGKELIAQILHQKSYRKEKPFLAIDCGAIPETLVESELFGYEKGAFTGAENRKEGKFEQANGGTLFLDEITNLPEAAQAKLLRVIEERRLQHLGGGKNIKVDVRIIVATNINLFEAVRLGKFRNELFHRLNEFQINLPPLRERKEDIPLLIKYFLDKANQELNKRIKGFSAETMKLLINYSWPGNVRELKNIVKKAVLLTDSNYITPVHISLNDTSSLVGRFLSNVNELHQDLNFQESLNEGGSLREITKKATKQMERNIIKQALSKTDGNKTKAAKILKIDRMTLYSKIKEFQLE